LNKIKLGVSACLMGERVRYDGTAKLDPFIVNTLGKFVEFVPVCPEFELGLGVPRETLRLTGDPANPHLVTSKTGIDRTGPMKRWAAQRLDELAKANLCGFIFKSRSPSSGMERVKVYTERGVQKSGVGIFARAFMDRFPLLPVEEEGRLHDPVLRENFIERVFVHQRLCEALAQNRPGALVEFHTRHKLLILAHSPKHYRSLGQIVARAGKPSFGKISREYSALLMDALKLIATPRKNVNVLQHALGFLKTHLTADEKQELLELFDMHAKSLVPLIVPITLVKHYVRKFDVPYLKEQYYLDPHPAELQLRNHA